MAPLTKKSKHLLQARLVKQDQTLITLPIDSNISSKFIDKAEKVKQELMNKINRFPEKQVFSCSKLLEIMIYPDGDHKGEIISPYLQKKAMNLLLLTLGKPESSAHEIENKIKSIEKKNKILTKKNESITSNHKSLAIKIKKQEKNKDLYISRIRSMVSKRKYLSKKEIHKGIKKMVKENKHTYTPEFIALVTQMSNIGQSSLSSTVQCTKEFFTFLTGDSPDTWISTSTLSRWNKEVAGITVTDNLPGTTSQFSSYGIMADESTRGDKKIFLVCVSHWNVVKEEPILTILSMKDLDRCNSATVSTSVLEATRSFNLNPNHCLYWLTDNTSYMSGSKGGAVVNFNQRCGISAIRIPCGLHVVHIAATTFDNAVFGKISSPSGLSLNPHPFNVINLAYHLHNGYNESNKDNPLNMKNETISKMYKALLNVDLKKYQKPITSRWLYQLTTAKQYLERRELHLTFANWFVEKLEGSRNVPEGYLHKWKTFLEFLQNENLNTEVLIMVKFGEWFYEKIIYFLIGSDTNSSHPLPNGYRAHQMPDMIQTWISELENVMQAPEEIFMDELLAAGDHLNEQEFLDLAQRMQIGIEKTLNVFKKWMITWTKFPLCICSLGGEHGPKFAQAVLHVILSHPLPDEQPTIIVKQYIERLNENLKDKSNSFGLFEALEKNNFREQFVAFSKANYTQLKEFPLIYDFVRHRIWSIIVHQQHLEGMFNRFDIRTHPNMCDSLRESRLQLSGPTSFNHEITAEKLRVTRIKRREKASLSMDPVIGEEEAIRLTEEFLIPKK